MIDSQIINHKLLSMLDQNESLLIFLSVDLQIIEVNNIAQKVLGKCIGKIVNEVLVTEISLTELLNLQKLSSSFSNKLPQFISITSGKQYIKWLIEPICNNNTSEDLEGFLMLGNNITRQKETEEKIYTLESILSNLPGNVYWMDKNCIHLGCSNNVLNMLGLTKEQYIGTTYEQLGKMAGWQGQGESFKKDDLEVMATRKPKKNVEEPLLIHKDGSAHYYLTTRVPLFNKQGEIIGVAGISTDITERKHIEKELVQAKTEAELANKAARVFAKSMAHELRTPLASINGYIYGVKKYLPALLKGYQLAKQKNLTVTKIRSNHYKSLASIIKNIESAISHANSVINMTLFRVNSNKLKNIKLKACSIQDCINEALTHYPFASLSQQALVHYKAENGFKFNGEKLFTIHILFNLLKNALYYIEKEQKGEINIWTSSELNYNNLHFKDTSKGISPAILPKIFDLYFSDTPHGTGVGLAFCKQVMEIFSGDIECRSEEGVYTEFILKFPILKTKEIH